MMRTLIATTAAIAAMALLPASASAFGAEINTEEGAPCDPACSVTITSTGGGIHWASGTSESYTVGYGGCDWELNGTINHEGHGFFTIIDIAPGWASECGSGVRECRDDWDDPWQFAIGYSGGDRYLVIRSCIWAGSTLGERTGRIALPMSEGTAPPHSADTGSEPIFYVNSQPGDTLGGPPYAIGLKGSWTIPGIEIGDAL